MNGKLNPTVFTPYNVIDSCSIWNLLSSQILYRAAVSDSASCLFSCTNYVYYECIIKRRHNTSLKENELKERLIQERSKGKQFCDYHLSIEDLQDLEILEKRKNLGKGELSSIVFAKKTNQSFMTDDRGARVLAESVLNKDKVQTIPHLFGWLMFNNFISDSDKDPIVQEHSSFRTTKRGNLTKFFEEMYKKALEFRLMHQSLS